MPLLNSLRPILLIDDDAYVGTMMRALLAKSGVRNQLLVYQDAHNALEFLERAAALASMQPAVVPCILFVDLMMPELDGFGVMKWVRSRSVLNDAKLVVLTASTDARDVERASSAGADLFLRKFPDAGHLAAVVKWSNEGGSAPNTVGA